MTEEGRPSTGQDIVKGRRTEIDFINGLVADKGDEAGIPTPTHRALVEVVKQVERKRGRARSQPGTSRLEACWDGADAGSASGLVTFNVGKRPCNWARVTHELTRPSPFAGGGLGRGYHG